MLSTMFRTCWQIVLVSCLLTACGGGGSGGEASAPSTPPSTDSGPEPEAPRFATLTGSAAKGLIANASVSAYQIEADGSRGALLGTAQTGVDGHYSLEILAQTAPVWIELNGAPSAYMVCDSLSGCGQSSDTEKDTNNNGSVDFGEKMPLAPGFHLRAVLPSAEQTQIKATISPLTHLAAILAETFPQGIDGLSAAMANSQVANLFELDGDILEMAVPDVTVSDQFGAATAKQRKYALVLGAFAALANEGDFVTLLETLSQQFQTLEGQLPQRSSDTYPISLSAWADKALQLATHLNDTLLVSAFSALKNTADLADNDTTSAAPDADISSNELEAAKSLIANIHGLKGTLNVTSVEAPLPGFSPLMDASEELSLNTSAMTEGSRLAAFVAVPKIALEASCNSISNYFTAYLCRSIVANKTLDEICALTFSSLNIGGKTLCEYLNALRLPAGNGMWAELALMDGVASVEGESDETRVDMQLMRGTTANDNQVSMDWTADIDSAAFSLEVPDGTINYHFDDLIHFSSLNNPNTIDSTFTAQLDLKADQVSRFRGTATTNIDLVDEDNPSASTRLDGVYTDSVGQAMDLNLSLTQQESVGSLMAVNLVHPDDGRNITVSLARSDSGDSIRMQWPGNTINAVTRIENNTLSINNGGAVSISLNLAAAEGEMVGRMKYNGKPYGDVEWAEGGLVVKLPNGQTAMLF